MLSVGRILRDYGEPGSVNGLLALWGFVDDTTFLTKAGHVGVVYRIRGVDYEGLSHAQRQAHAHRFEAGFRLLDEHCRVYQYLLKRTVAPFAAATCERAIANEALQRRAAHLNDRRDTLYDLSLYLVLLYEAPHVQRRTSELPRFWQAPPQALRGWLSTDRTLQFVESELDRAIGALHHKAQAFEVQIGEFGSPRLEKQAAFRFFRELVNYDPAVVDAARLTHDTHLGYFVSDCGPRPATVALPQYRGRDDHALLPGPPPDRLPSGWRRAPLLVLGPSVGSLRVSPRKRVLYPLLDKLCIKRAGLHAFRHSRVTMLRKAGTPADLQTKWIGHSSLKTGDRYNHANAELEYRQRIASSVGIDRV